jgi:hypothetical protein
MSDKINKILNIVKEMWYLPFLIYLIGFVYIQGVFSPFVSDDFIFKGFLSVVPVPQSVYLFNGLYLSFIILAIPILCGFGLYRFDISRTADFFERKFKKYSILFLTFPYFIFMLLIDGSIVFFAMEGTLSIGETIVAYLILFIFHINITVIALKIHIKITELKGYSKALTGIIFWFSIFIFIFCVFLFGLNTQISIFNGFKNQKENLEYAQITKEDGSKEEYIKLDISSDFFIGYDFNSKRAIYFPMDKVSNIQTFKKQNSDYKKLYDPEANMEMIEKMVINKVAQYYTILMKPKMVVTKKDAEDFQKLFSAETYTNLISKSAEIQFKQLKKENYRDKEPQDYYGYDISVPSEDKEGRLLIFVREYWKGENIDIVFQLSKNGSIMKIEHTSFNFKV